MFRKVNSIELSKGDVLYCGSGGHLGEPQIIVLRSKNEKII